MHHKSKFTHILPCQRIVVFFSVWCEFNIFILIPLVKRFIKLFDWLNGLINALRLEEQQNVKFSHVRTKNNGKSEEIRFFFMFSWWNKNNATLGGYSWVYSVGQSLLLSSHFIKFNTVAKAKKMNYRRWTGNNS